MFIAAFLFISCGSDSVAPDRESSAIEAVDIDTAAIRASLDSLGKVVSRALRSGDAELYASTLAKNSVMSGAGKPLVQGRDSIVAAFKQRPSFPPDAEITIHPVEMRVLSERWAYVFGVDSLTYTPENAVEPVTQTSTFLVIIQKTPEGWKTFREVLSANQ